MFPELASMVAKWVEGLLYKHQRVSKQSYDVPLMYLQIIMLKRNKI